jgi:hypothetical protein
MQLQCTMITTTKTPPITEYIGSCLSTYIGSCLSMNIGSCLSTYIVHFVAHDSVQWHISQNIRPCSHMVPYIGTWLKECKILQCSTLIFEFLDYYLDIETLINLSDINMKTYCFIVDCCYKWQPWQMNSSRKVILHRCL